MTSLRRRFKLLGETKSERMSLVHLLDNGSSIAPRNAMCLSGELLKYIQKNFRGEFKN
jgi:hypothetical protein